MADPRQTVTPESSLPAAAANADPWRANLNEATRSGNRATVDRRGPVTPATLAIPISDLPPAEKMKRLLGPFFRLFNRAMAPLGYRLTNTAPKNSDPTLPGMLLRVRGRGYKFRTVIDVGASNSSWSREVTKFLPDVRNFILVEAQPVHRPGLDAFAAEFPATRIVQAAAGDRCGEIFFEASDPWGGLAAEQPGTNGGKWVKCPVTTLDAEVAASGFVGPYLIKLDTHGYERAILAGAAATLRQAELIVVECYNFDVAGTALRIPEFCQYMAGLGFRPIDCFDVGYRAWDQAYWQCDMVFARSDAPAFATNRCR